jgi:hypothetical protein
MMEEMDPIGQLREVRRKIVAKAGGTPAALMRYLRSLEKKEGQRPREKTPRSGSGKRRKTAVR